MKILCTGGGTLGPVTPLLAVIREMKRQRPGLEFVWAGTETGPEKAVVEAESVEFYAIPDSRLPRYLSLRLLAWPINFLRSNLAAKKLVEEVRPSLVVSVGGFTGVPVIRAARKKNIPCAIHQLDAEPGLSNKLVAKMCQSVTTSFQYDVRPFAGVKSEQLPTPSRFAGHVSPERGASAKSFHLDADKPIVLVVGGGTGAKAINDAIWDMLDGLLKFTQIIHVTGKGKNSGTRKKNGYIMREFLNEQEMLQAYSAADLVVSRAGMGGITDLIALKKPAILVPIPNSHQEKNASQAPFPVVPQGKGFGPRLGAEILGLLQKEEKMKSLVKLAASALPVDTGSTLAKKWLGLLKEKSG